jgi:hypothetical protein
MLHCVVPHINFQKNLYLTYCCRNIINRIINSEFSGDYYNGGTKMAGNKTSDGIRLSKILKLAREIGVEIRDGTNHPHILNYQGLRPCPIAASTHAERMVAPWIAEVTGLARKEAYKALRRGYLNE